MHSSQDFENKSLWVLGFFPFPDNLVVILLVYGLARRDCISELMCLPCGEGNRLKITSV